MTRLYSYCIPVDDGAAPNPYWGVCTLVICKPAIRRTAEVGDWIGGTGAKYARLGNDSVDMRGRLVYAMKVTRKMTMREYDRYTQQELPDKLPAWRDKDKRRRLGDAIYDFSIDPPRLRDSVHRPSNVETDLSGKFALLSDHFFYFGDHAPLLPDDLRAIAQNQQGHRSALNAPYVARFASWIESLGCGAGTLMGAPLLDLFARDDDSLAQWCATAAAEADELDLEDRGGC